MKNIFLFLIGKYRKSIVVEHKKQIWKHYQKHGFTNVGYNIHNQIK